MHRDTEGSASTVHVKGYASLAHFIASDRDKSTAIYRRFDELSARNLLYLQSELAELEERQRQFDRDDRNGTTEEKESARNWNTFKTRAKDPARTRDKERMELMLEIRGKLKEYREAILLEEALISIKPPPSRVLEAFRNHFNNLRDDTPKSKSEEFPTLGGASANILNNPQDLMALHLPAEDDRLTNFLRSYFPAIFIERQTNTPLTYISEKRLRIFVASVNVILAAGLLFGPIYNLYYVTEDRKRLGLITVYTVAFAGCIGLLTNAKRPEVFTACAAYAAVLVVFVSGKLAS